MTPNKLNNNPAQVLSHMFTVGQSKSGSKQDVPFAFG